ncbi:hypothetical protein R0K05_15980 [Planococcus sp. SIMBA_160]
MSIITVFRNYMQVYHPHLTEKEWRVDVRTVLVNSLKNKGVRTIISNRKNRELTYWVFPYDDNTSHIVYVLQDEKDPKNIGISLLKNGVLINPISIYEGEADWYRAQLNMITSVRRLL